jgi:peptidoglycan/LPS O-acetylase OafA/YrhL
MNKHEKLLELDFFRTMAVLLVFVAHFYVVIWGMKPTGYPSLDRLMLNGSVGVDLFFVLSGFLLPYTLKAAELKGQRSFKDYFKKRVRRIIPEYYFCLLLILIFTPVYFTTPSGWLNIGAHILFLQNLFRDTHASINAVAWTLGVEMQFYALLPLLFVVFYKSPKTVLSLLLGSFAVTWGYRGLLYTRLYASWDQFDRFIYIDQLVGRIDQFAIGIASSFVYLQWGQKVRELAKKSTIIPAMSSLVFLGGFVGFYSWVEILSSTQPNLYTTMFAHTILAAIFGIMILASFVLIRPLRYVVHHRLFQYLALISYGIYLWHLIVINSLAPLGISRFHKAVLALALTIIISHLSYKYIGLPFLKSKKRAEV